MSFNRELIGVYQSTDQVFDNGPERRCIVGTVRLLDGKNKTVKGYASEETLECGITYRFFGQPKTHPKYGEQFNFSSICPEIPIDEDSILAYLETCRKPERGSITRRVATLLYERCGIEVIDRLIADPIGTALDIKQWDAAKAAKAAEYLNGRERTRGCTLDLITILNGRGFPKKTVDRAISEWGAAAAVTIRTDPYSLLQLSGIGFKGADKLYCDLSKEQATSPEDYQARLAAIQRQGLCATYAATSDNSGSTWMDYGRMVGAIKSAIGNTQAKPTEALEWAVMEGRLAKYTDHEGDWYAVGRRALNEADVAAFIAESGEQHQWPITEQIMKFAPEDKPLSEHQLAALDVALTSRVCCFQGSPGCLHADTKVYDPTDGSTLTVKDRMHQGKGFHVLSLDASNQLIIAKAECPKVYPLSEMLKFDFESGRSITVTRGHRFWSGDSYVSAERLQFLVEYGEVHLPSISEHDLVAHVQDVQHWKKTTGDSLECCSACSHQCDGQLQLSKDSFRSLLPSQVDVHERTFSFRHKSRYIHHRPTFCLLSTTNYGAQIVPHFVGVESHYFHEGFGEPFAGWSLPEQTPYESQDQWHKAKEQIPFFSERPADQLSLLSFSSFDKVSHIEGYTGFDGTSLKCIVTDRIVNIQSVPSDLYYDFHVPVHENYWAAGCFHHNTGKTFCVASIVKALIHKFGRDAIAVAAPTGKAGVRVSQSMAANGVDLPASTIHRLLGVVSEGKGGTWDFNHHEQNPLPQKFVVIDEASMVPTELLSSLVRACTPTTHILFVGDSNQLAPVGHGRPFLDLQTVVPTGHLTEIRRNSGRIVRACAEIRDTRKISFSPTLDIAGGENMPLIAVGPDDQVAALETLMGHIANRVKDPIDDIQIVTAKNDGSPVSRKPLNKLLQGRLNPDGERIDGNPFKIGDKVVCVRNGKYQDAEEQSEEHFTANGELGRVISLRPGRMVIRLSDPVRQIVVIHGPIQENEAGIADSEDSAQRGAVGDWDLAYAISVHRSQGSQWPYVIVMADNAGQMVQTRNWIYTAISRAETVTYVVGERAVVNAMMRRDGISGRKTFLVVEIQRLRLAYRIDYESLFGDV